jgi:hypothetical protein
MADWYRSKQTVITIQYHIPVDEAWGANWNQVQVALNAAVREWHEIHPEYPGKEPPDSAIRFRVNDDEIIIGFQGNDNL